MWAEEKESHEKVFESVDLAMVHRSEYAMPYETSLPIYICRKTKMPIENIWPKLKYYAQVDRFPAGVQKVLFTSCVGDGVVQIRRFSSLNVVEITFRPTFWTPSAQTRRKNP